MTNLGEGAPPPSRSPRRARGTTNKAGRPNPLAGRAVLVTGAARGIGAATARRLAAVGARVALVGLEPDLLRAVTESLPTTNGSHAWFECDVTDQAAVDRAVAGAVDALGGIDAVVSNAGIANRGTIAINPVEALTRTIEVNLLGTVRTISATLPHVTAARGYYLLVASAAAFTAMPGLGAYAASKAGVEQYGNTLRLEVAHKGVGVGVAYMTWIDTDMVRDLSDDLPTFDDSRRKLPGPLGAYTSVEACAEAFVDGITRRRDTVFVPDSLSRVSAMRMLMRGRAVQWLVRRDAAKTVPQLEDDIRGLGRYFGKNSAGHE